MPVWLVFVSALPLLALLFLATWAVQRFVLAHNDAGIVDVVWAISIPLICLYYFLMIDGDLARQLLLLAMSFVWGIRLAWFMFSTRIRGKPEDTRYQQMREEWGDKVQLWFLAFYQIQAVAAWLLTIGFVAIFADTRPFALFDPLTGIAVVLFVVALIGESTADRQLAKFKSNPNNRGQVYRHGLWAYSRHPNYFFEWLIWISYAALGILAAYGWLTIVSALLMLFFLTMLSGIKNNEQQNLRSKPETYARYQAEVSPFIPWFPRKPR